MSDYTSMKVRGFHLDNYGHLTNSGYIEFLEEARWALFENFNAIDFFSKHELALTLVNININYRHPAVLNDSLEISTKVMRVGNSSCLINQTIYLAHNNKVIAECAATFALMDKKSHRSIPFTSSTRMKLEQIANHS